MNNGVVEMGLNLIPAGYKQTEVGVIPEDWELKYLGEICNFENGDRSSNYPSAHEFSNSGIPFINAGHVSEGKIDLADMDYIPTHVYERLGGGKVKSGDLVYCLRGSLGKFGVVSDDFGLGAVASSLVIVRPKKSTTTKFVSAYFKSNIAKNMISLWAGGAAQPNLGAKELANFLVPLPDSQEQTAIANALSDVDALISELEKLIAKKQAIKTATMQQLLTGRTRLPQFALREDGTPKGTKPSELGEIPEDWKVKMVFELADCQKSLFDDGDWIEAEHITNKGIRLIQTGNIGVGRYVDKDTKKYIFKESFEKLKCKELHEGDLLICRLAEPAGRACIFPYIGEDKVITSVDVTIFRPLHEVTSREFYNQYFSSSDWFKSVLEQVGGTTHKRISRGALGRISVRYPNIEEQTAIATMLSDMDKEIQALEQRLSKTRQIKQGMMQELLTGKTRLIKPSIHE
ncbi:MULTISPECIES: restriction endonuclease subunit S [unclassified Providencia]|uniref:restriction endonuclease subunit S n=1 Tax=unclassified Providencia TaxID=2633465 RepID=UPI002349DD9A|nr:MULTISPECIES: restriction endonuclease subunit S [unclassified Providencia]